MPPQVDLEDVMRVAKELDLGQVTDCRGEKLCKELLTYLKTLPPFCC
jgi:hypothetical protein